GRRDALQQRLDLRIEHGSASQSRPYTPPAGSRAIRRFEAADLSCARLLQKTRSLAGKLAAMHEQLPASAAELTPQHGRSYAGHECGAHTGGDVRRREEALLAGDDDARSQHAQGARIELGQLLGAARESLVIIVGG